MLRKISVLGVLGSFVYFSSPGFAQSGHEGMHHGEKPAASGQESAYMKETMASMDTMHKEMADPSKMTGNPDHDFMLMMIPHHKGALDMAEIYLKYGKEEKVKKLARKIIADQKKEIAQMEKWLKDGATAKK
jgi:uncharacterized protein (DUF305 family)